MKANYACPDFTLSSATFRMDPRKRVGASYFTTATHVGDADFIGNC